MAIGDFVNLGSQAYTIELLASATVANGAPTGNAGLAASSVSALLGYVPNTIRVAVVSTAGSDVMTVTLRLWMKLGSVGWVVARSLNGGSAIAETGPNSISYSEEVATVGGADRYYLEIVGITGTATAVTGYFIVAPRVEA